eukprot:524397-Hanusia_phi.AAC.1
MAGGAQYYRPGSHRVTGHGSPGRARRSARVGSRPAARRRRVTPVSPTLPVVRSLVAALAGRAAETPGRPNTARRGRYGSTVTVPV